MAIEVFRFKYRRPLQDKNIEWTAHIAAYSRKEAEEYLFKTVGTKVWIEEYTSTCRLDAVSDKVRDAILKPYKEKLEGSENRKDKEDDGENKGPGRPSGPSSISKATKKINITKKD